LLRDGAALGAVATCAERARERERDSKATSGCRGGDVLFSWRRFGKGTRSDGVPHDGPTKLDAD